MRALATAWRNGGGTVVGLAPSAAAAAQLGAQIDTHADTMALLTHALNHRRPLPAWAERIGPTSLVIIDEAGMADTLSLDQVVEFVLDRGGSVRLIGDDQQLAAIGAGGVLRDIQATHGAVQLNELVRFADPAEGAASLALRAGDPEALGFYLDNHRVHVGDLGTCADQVFDSWLTARHAGADALMVAPTRALVAELNARAQAHLHDGIHPTRTVALADGSNAAVGDVIITRLNDRRLRTSGTDWVRNGDRWTITGIATNGDLRAIHQTNRQTVILPAGYVAESVELGYACTIHGAQGVTADVLHGIATGAETRQQLYTMLTRGRYANHVHLEVVGDGDAHSLIRPEAIIPPTATDLLERILARDEDNTSATTTARTLADPANRLADAVARYSDALGYAAEQTAGADLVQRLEQAADELVDGLTDAPAWPTLRAHLLLIAASGTDPVRALTEAVQARELGSAADPAAVLDWRLEPATGRDTQPGPLPVAARSARQPRPAQRLGRLPAAAPRTRRRTRRSGARPGAGVHPAPGVGAGGQLPSGRRHRRRPHRVARRAPALPPPTPDPPANGSTQLLKPAGRPASTGASSTTSPPPSPNGRRCSTSSRPPPTGTPTSPSWRIGSRRSPASAWTPTGSSTPPPTKASSPTTTRRQPCGGGSAGTSPPPSPPSSPTSTTPSPPVGWLISSRTSAPNGQPPCRPRRGGRRSSSRSSRHSPAAGSSPT